MVDVAFRLLHSSFILQKNTILPHIEATKMMLAGDQDLLNKTLLADEFDILTDSSMKFNHLPEEYKVLVGYDNLRLIQSFETILYMYENDSKRKSLNEYVKMNLKSMLAFKDKNKKEQEDLLNTYWDYLSSLEHEENRILALVVHVFLPSVLEYLNKIKFLFCNKKNVNSILCMSEKLQEEHKDLIPTTDFFQESVSGGIQKLIKENP